MSRQSIPLWFHDHGTPVFPLIRGTKDPAVKWKSHHITRDTARRLTHYGVWLRELVVVDADNPGAAEWIREHCPATPFRVTTGPYHYGSPGRGLHHYYRRATVLDKFIRRDGLTIESRNGDQYVVGPESRHPSGELYTPSEWSWQWSDIPIFPSDFLFDDGSCGARSSAATLGDTFVFPDVVQAGERHDMLFRQLRSWRHIFERDEARENLHLMNLAHCQPPLIEDADFEAWFRRSWNQEDRPFPATSELRGVASPLRGVRGL